VTKELPTYPSGPRHWRSLEELAQTPEFQAALSGESSADILAQAEGLDRRDLMKFLGVSFALAGLTACTRQPAEKIVPYVRQPEEIIPGGRPLFFATAHTVSGSATGLLIESHMGRPTKAEGNPSHPASLGACDLYSQASLYELYDPDRSQTLTYLEEIRPWPSFLGAMRVAVESERAHKGAGLRILTETVSSPTLAAQIAALLSEMPEAQWVQWESATRDQTRAGALAAFGRHAEVVPRIDRAQIIVSLGADFLTSGRGHLRHARDYAAGRRALAGGEGHRLYVVESTATVTGANADHRRPLRPSEMESFVHALAAAVGGSGGSPSDPFLAAVAADLRSHRGRSVVLAGDAEPPAVHALAHHINSVLGNFGETIAVIDPIEARPADQLGELRTLLADIDAGKVSTLVILGGNPVYDAPGDLRFAERLEKIKLRVHQSLYADETSRLCHWHIPAAHYLEGWSDARAFDGTASIVQPLIAPLYDGHSAHEVLAALSQNPEKSGYELVRATWQARMGRDFESQWRQALHDGVIAGTAFEPRNIAAASASVAEGGLGQAPARRSETSGRSPDASDAIEIVFRPDAKVYDGRFANNGWLQELGHPITRLTWDNAALVSIATAQRLDLRKEDVVEISSGNGKVLAPVWIEPGLPDGSVTVHLGYGRRRAGHFGTGSGFDAAPIRSSGNLWWAAGQIRKTGDRRELSCVQLHQNMEGREIVRAATAAEFRKNPSFVHEHEKEPGAEETLYPLIPSDTYAWSLSIDLTSCIGCNA